MRDHFVWNEEGRMLQKEEEEGDGEEVKESSVKEIMTKVGIALGSTQNSSVSGPDSISYRFINMIKDTILRDRILEEVGKNLIKGTMLREWQSSKVVMISKPRKDHEKTKG